MDEADIPDSRKEFKDFLEDLLSKADDPNHTTITTSWRSSQCDIYEYGEHILSVKISRPAIKLTEEYSNYQFLSNRLRGVVDVLREKGYALEKPKTQAPSRYH